MVLLFHRRFWVEDDFFGCLLPSATPPKDFEAQRGAPLRLWTPRPRPPTTHSSSGAAALGPKYHPAPTCDPDRTPGEFFLFWNLERSHGLPALACISSGQFAAGTWKRMNYKAVVKAALASLERAHGEQVRALPLT